MSGINPVLANALANPPMADPKYWGQQMENMNALQDYNAKQAWGQALQQATDPTTGTVDYGKAQALAAGNPMARAGMATNLATTSNIRSQQIDQTSGLYNLVGRMSASLMKDPSDANVAAIRAQAVNAGLPPGALTEIDRIAALPVDQRATEAYNHNVGALDALGRIHQTVGQTTLQNVGGTVAPVTLNQPTPTASGSATVGLGSIPITLTPGEATGLDSIDIGGGNHIQVPHAMVGDVLKNNPGWKAIIGSSGGGGGGGAANNPLNMRFVGQPGATNSGGFAAFSTPEAGQAATDALFRSYAAGGINTLSGLISKWAPPSENDTAGYIARVAKATGLDPNAPIDLTNPAIATKIQQAMATVEGNKNASVAPLAPAATTTPPAAPAGPPGVQMGGTPPPPPGGSQAPYTGGGVGAALAPGGAANPVVIRGAPIPAGRVVGAIQQGMQTAAATPMPANALMAGPGAPSAVASAPASPTMPQSGWGSVVGSYGGGPAAPAAPTPTAPAVAPQPAAQPAAAPTLGVSAPPGYVEAQKITAEAGAKRGNDLVNQLTASSTVKPILAEMEDVLTKSGGTGFGTAHISAFRQALERLGLTPAAVDVATPQAALETFKKLSAQLQGAQLGTVGGVPTDDRQSLIEASNPSVLNSTAGNKSIIHVLQGTQQALETMGRAWMASPEYQNNPGKFDNWRTKFTAKDPTTGGQFDPRTFWLNNMPPDEQHAYLSNMTPKGLAEFKKNWAYARGQGWVEPLPGQPAPGG